MPLARLNIPSVFLSRQRDEGATTDDGMKSPLRASCSDKRRTGFPASLSVARPSYTFLMRAVVLPQLSGKSRQLVRDIRYHRFFYSVLITPMSAPQCLHLTIKSGYRSVSGVINCTFVSNPASISLCPHFGQRTGRIPVFISCVDSSFFLRIVTYAPSWYCRRPAGEESVTCYDILRYMTSSDSQGAIGLASRRAFKYAISRVRQVLPR